MSNKTIAKFAVIVILFAFAILGSGCTPSPPKERYVVNASEFSPDFSKPAILGRIESPDVIESSGLAESLCQPDVLWTHNDSGDNAFIFALTSKGKHLGTWRVTNAKNDDWEDLATAKDASGNCYLYIGDVGNNELKRTTQQVYRVREPAISASTESSSKKDPLQTDPAESFVFRYPDTPHNAETLMIEPRSGYLYVLTKRLDGPSMVFRVQPAFGSATPVVAERMAEVAVPSVPNGLLTGGAISPNGDQLVLCDYTAAYLMTTAGSNFEDVWQQKPVIIDLGDRKQGEAVSFSADGKSILATSEKKGSPIISVTAK